MPELVDEVKLDFKDVLLVPDDSRVDSRNDVDLVKVYKFKWGSNEYRGIPIMAANMDTVGTFEMAKTLSAHNIFTCIHKQAEPKDWQEFVKSNPGAIKHVAVSTGISDSDQKRLDSILELVPEVEFICIDVANGYLESFLEFVRKIRQKYPKKIILAGNVVTGRRVKALIEAGADIVKVGIGPGSVCTTRKMTGVGFPQFSAVWECALAAHELGGHIISDGGCVDPGDVSKAFGAGADFVMLGGMFAGHDQCAGDIETLPNGTKVKKFYGMASKHAQEKYNSGLASYRASEGRLVQVPYRGDITRTALELLGGLRSTCAYVGAHHLANLPERATFIKVHRQLNEVFSHYEIK